MSISIDVYVSYSHEDQEPVQRIVHALEREGLHCFVDFEVSTPIAKSRRNEIREILHSVRCVLVVWSKQSISSDWIHGEAIIAQQRGVLIPILIEAVRPPAGFDMINSLDLSAWNGDTQDSRFLSLLETIKRVITYPNQQGTDSGLSRSKTAQVSQQPDLAADTGLESNTPSAKSEADAEQTNPRDAEAQGNGKRGFKTFTRLHVAKWLRLTTLAGVGLLGIYGSITLARLGLSDMDSPQTDKQSQPCLTQPGQGPEMVLIRGGTFEMGSNESTDETPVHQVSVKDFAIGRCEVTFDEYDRFAEATKREKPDDWGFGRGNRPVIAVSWEDARAYADWLSKQTRKQYRLPTEAEWEYAARAGTTTAYWWGNEIRQDQRVWANCNGCGSEWDSKETAPVGSFPANPFGLQDTAGNVWEWVEDCWHENYQDAPQDGSAWLEANGGKCEGRVVRGGSWILNPRWLRAALRDGYHPSVRIYDLGFRLVQDLPQ